MKYLLIAVLMFSALSFLGCRESNEKPVKKAITKDSLAHAEDTFQTIRLHESPGYVQHGTIIDSVQYGYRGSKAVFFANFPKLSQKEFPEVNKWVKEFLKEQHGDYIEIRKESDEDMSDRFIGTKLFYKDDKVISLVLDEWETDGMNRSIWTHHSFNYDVKMRKPMNISDYFILQSAADTLFMNHVVSRSVGARKGEELDMRQFGDGFGSSFSFAIDSANIFFFFDRYSVHGIGDWITIVPKKYIREHIRPEYR